MKRFTSLLIAIMIIAALVPLSLFSATATAGVFTPTLANYYRDLEADTVIWASNSPYASIDTLYGNSFNYWYLAYLSYDSASGAYVVSGTSGFDTNGNSIRPDTTYESWTLGSGKLIIMAKTLASDADGLALIRSLHTGDKLYLTGSFNTIVATTGTINGISLSKTAPASGDDSDDSSSDTPELESEFDIDISAPSKYNPGESIEVTVTPESITGDGISLITFDFHYDSTLLTLKNTVDSNDALDCLATLPSGEWDNLSTAEDGTVHVRYLTASMEDTDWASADGDMSFVFKFDISASATGDLAFSADSIIAATNTESGTDKYTGNGGRITVAENKTAVTVKIDAPENYIPGEELSVTVSATSIKVSGGISFLSFEIAYDSDILTLVGAFDSNDALDCVTAVPSANWDNLTTAEDGLIKVRLLTASMDSSEWASDNGDILLTLKFTADENATASTAISVSDTSVIAAQNTESGTDRYDGMGASVTLVKGEKPEPSPYAMGDVNRDGHVNGQDYALLKRSVLGTYTLDSEQKELGNINGDAHINAQDYTLLKRIVLQTYTLG